MKKLLFAAWLIVGIAMALWHFGPGQAAAQRDAAASTVNRALQNHQLGKPEQAVALYAQALTMLPPEDATSRAAVRIGLAKARMDASGLPEARADMESLVSELPPNTDPTVLNAARRTLAETQYYNTWLMRLEGLPREEWEPEIESARQLLRNQVESTPPDAPAREQEERNLEATIRMARMDLTDLQGIPIPSQCRGCKSCRGSKPGTKKKAQKPNDDVRSAGGSLDFDYTGD